MQMKRPWRFFEFEAVREHPERHEHQQRQHDQRADDAPCLPDIGEDEVVVHLRDGDIVPIDESLPEHPAIGEGGEGMVLLVLQILRVHAGVDEDEDAVLVRILQDEIPGKQRRKRDRHNRREDIPQGNLAAHSSAMKMTANTIAVP